VATGVFGSSRKRVNRMWHSSVRKISIQRSLPKSPEGRVLSVVNRGGEGKFVRELKKNSQKNRGAENLVHNSLWQAAENRSHVSYSNVSKVTTTEKILGRYYVTKEKRGGHYDAISFQPEKQRKT